MSDAGLLTMTKQIAGTEIVRSSAKPNQFQDVQQARILIVDDEPLNIDVVQGYLEMDGYRNIQSTEHAIHALPLLGTFRPDLVLLDIHMPEVSGLEILKA